LKKIESLGLNCKKVKTLSLFSRIWFPTRFSAIQACGLQLIHDSFNLAFVNAWGAETPNQFGGISSKIREIVGFLPIVTTVRFRPVFFQILSNFNRLFIPSLSF